MSALRFGLKCSRTNVYAPLLNQIDALTLNRIYYFWDIFPLLFSIVEFYFPWFTKVSLNHSGVLYGLFSRQRKLQRVFVLCGKLSCLGVTLYWPGWSTNAAAQHDQVCAMRSMLANMSARGHRVSASFSRAVGWCGHDGSDSMPGMRPTALFHGVSAKSGKWDGCKQWAALPAAPATAGRFEVAT